MDSGVMLSGAGCDQGGAVPGEQPGGGHSPAAAASQARGQVPDRRGCQGEGAHDRCVNKTRFSNVYTKSKCGHFIFAISPTFSTLLEFQIMVSLVYCRYGDG